MQPLKQKFINAVKILLSWLPASTTLFIYTKVLSVPPLNYIRDMLIKKILPPKVRIGDAVLAINPKDAVISGALAFGCYELFETDLFKHTIKPGMTVVDIGANIGYYTTLAGLCAGPTGKVIAYEPDVDNFSFLNKNIALNNLSNTRTLQTALSDKHGTATLYLTENNKGTHSFANNRNGKKAVTVQTETLDDSLWNINAGKIDVLKIDIEGAECLALAGMKKTLAKNRDLIIFTEFYPKAIRRLGKDPLDMLKTLTDAGFSLQIIDEDAKKLIPLTVNEFETFLDRFPRGERVQNIYASRKVDSPQAI